MATPSASARNVRLIPKSIASRRVSGFHLDGTWFESMYEQLPPAIEQVRRGAGPILIEADVVRLDPHSSSDDHRKYRPSDELASLPDRDPLLRTERYLVDRRVLTQDEIETWRASIKAEVDRAAGEADSYRSEEHMSELQSLRHLVCR